MVILMTMVKHLEVTQARRALILKQAKNTAPFSTLVTHGSLVVEVYQSVTTDHQKPHDRDEYYVIIEVYGKFEMGNEIVSFDPSDFLFVPAGLPHRFTDFGDTMSTWLMFYGLNGGKTANSPKKTG